MRRKWPGFRLLDKPKTFATIPRVKRIPDFRSQFFTCNTNFGAIRLVRNYHSNEFNAPRLENVKSNGIVRSWRLQCIGSNTTYTVIVKTMVNMSILQLFETRMISGYIDWMLRLFNLRYSLEIQSSLTCRQNIDRTRNIFLFIPVGAPKNLRPGARGFNTLCQILPRVTCSLRP